MLIASLRFQTTRFHSLIFFFEWRYVLAYDRGSGRGLTKSQNENFRDLFQAKYYWTRETYMIVSSRSSHLLIKQLILFYTHSCMFRLRVKPTSVYSRISTAVRIISLSVRRRDADLSPFFPKPTVTALCSICCYCSLMA